MPDKFDHQTFYSGQPFEFGVIDMFFLGKRKDENWIEEILSVFLTACDQNYELIVKELIVILPPTSLTGLDEEQVVQGISDFFLLRRGEALDDEEVAILQRRLKIINSSNLEIESLISIFENVNKNSFFIIVNASLYRSENVVSRGPDFKGIKTEEDDIALQLYHLVDKSIGFMRSNESYLYVDVGRFLPVRETNQKLLNALDDRCAIVGYRRDNDPDSVITSFFERWGAMLKAGQSNEILTEIDSLPDSIDEDVKFQLKIQLLIASNRRGEAQSLIKESPQKFDSFSPELRLKCASLALMEDDHETCKSTLQHCISELTNLKFLEEALSLAEILSDKKVTSAIKTRINHLYPDSLVSRKSKLKEKLVFCHKLGAENSPEERNGESEELRDRLTNSIEQFTQKNSESDLGFLCKEILRDLDASSGDKQLLMLVYAKGSSDFIYILGNTRFSNLETEFQLEKAFDILLWAIETSLIGEKGIKNNLNYHDFLCDALVQACNYLARCPDQPSLRIRFDQSLSVQASGLTGVSALAKVVIDQVKSTKNEDCASGELFLLELDEADNGFDIDFKVVSEWMIENAPIVLGVSNLPQNLLKNDPDVFMQHLFRMSGYLGKDGDDPSQVADMLVVLGSLIAPLCSRSAQDLVLIRMVGSKMASLHYNQKARDYAEQALELSGGDELRNRLAWFAFADIYQRVHNPFEALVAIACSFFSTATVSREQMLYEVIAIVRILRDLNLFEIALRFLPDVKSLLEELGFSKKYEHRITTLEIGIRIFKIGINRKMESDSLSLLLEDASLNLKQAIDANDEILPSVSNLVQAIKLCEQGGLVVNDSFRQQALNAGADMTVNHIRLLRALSNELQDPEDLFNLVRTISSSRYSHDVGFDIRVPAMMARRLLNNVETVSPCVFSVELLSDQSLLSSNFGLLYENIDGVREFAEKISFENALDLVFLAYSEQERIIQISLIDGEWSDIQNVSVSSEVLSNWSQRFPYDYGLVEREDTNLFFQSMESLKIEISTIRKTLIVSDVTLQNIPVNLLMSNREFLGSKYPVTTVPSLSWLSQDQANPRRYLDNIAWLPTESDVSKSGIITYLNEWIRDTLEKHQIEVKNQSSIPSELSGRELVIVGAHGGVYQSGKYFSAVSDDEKSISVGQMSLAQALEGTKVVILFVCSAGRSDKHPYSNATVGLCRELLKSGCSSVIASPWPVVATVTTFWLPEFLDRWKEGNTVTQANFLANKAVCNSVGFVPQKMLAMSVYGNPLVTKESYGSSGNATE